MTDRYAVFGHPVAHSRSPQIHAEFARLTGQSMRYERILAPLDGFAAAVAAFRAAGGRGANVTVPFKREAWQLCDVLSERAQVAEAVNTLRFDGAAMHGDNTDGAGLVRDLEANLGQPLAGARVLMLGAGGAAAGVLLPLLAAGVAQLQVINRTPERARALVQRVAGSVGRGVRLEASTFAAADGEFDLVLNATSASLGSEAPRVEPGRARLAADALCYDMMYGSEPTPFLLAARARGARIADGIGMLIEQAAESFLIWRGVRPDTQALLAQSAQPWRAARRGDAPAHAG
jgi:shikimate dehydrogenase